MSRLLLLLCLFTSLAGCRQPIEVPPAEPPKVTVALPILQDVELYQEFTGRTRAVERAEIRARVQGVLEKIHFKDSDDIIVGQSLFTIEPDTYQAALRRAQADLESDQAAFQLAQANLGRGRILIEKKVITRQDYDILEAEVAQTHAEISGSQAVITAAELQLDYTNVVSPISGRINRNLVDVGNLVGASERTLLATVVRLDPIHAYFDVDEQTYLRFLNENGGSRRDPSQDKKRSAVFLARQYDSGYPFEGTIDFIDNEIDSNTGTILARGVFKNPDYKITPGNFVRLRLPRKVQKNAVLVREEAIGTDMQGKFVLVIDAKNIVQQRRVELGALQEGLRVIESGLAAEDKYIVKGIQRARPGMPVRPEMEQATDSSQLQKTPASPATSSDASS